MLVNFFLKLIIKRSIYTNLNLVDVHFLLWKMHTLMHKQTPELPYTHHSFANTNSGPNKPFGASVFAKSAFFNQIFLPPPPSGSPTLDPREK